MEICRSVVSITHEDIDLTINVGVCAFVRLLAKTIDSVKEDAIVDSVRMVLYLESEEQDVQAHKRDKHL